MKRFVITALLLSAMNSVWVLAQTPYWDNGAGASYQPVAWPNEPSDPLQCGNSCGDWIPYTRFGNTINDPRTKDPSNGGTSPQNYVNIASSCTDTASPSVYYALHRGAANDGSQDVILFRWRVEQIANTYATGPNAGSFGSSHPWNSALWTVLFDLDGDGYRDLAAHLDGSSGSPSNPIDILAGIWGQIPTQSIDYSDANIQLIDVQSTAFVDRNTDLVLNFQDNLTPVATWPNGSSETVWDYGSTRAVKVSSRPCNEYFIDYQIPVALLDASSLGGPKVERSTPISMLFCTANSLNNPFQKDCALNRPWIADPTKPAPFGDYVSFELTEPYRQPIVRQLTVEAPQSCSSGTELLANIQDTLVLNNSGEAEISVKAASFWYYFDANGDGAANDAGSVWLKATDGSPVPGSLGQWSGNWDTSTLPKGRYLIGVQAVDDRTKIDDGGVPAARDHRTFSYVTSNAQGELYVNGAWVTFNSASLENSFPTHGPNQLAPVATEDWFGNPAITGATIATVGVDVALNNCGVAPTITKTVSPAEVAPGGTVSYTISIANPASNPDAITVSEFEDTLPAGFAYASGSSAGATSTDPTVASQTLTWTLASPISIAAGSSASLSFNATVSSTAGTYNNTAKATTSFGEITSEPVAVKVDAPRVSLTKTPSQYLISPDGTTVLSYGLTWNNSSTIPLASAVIKDTLASDITYVSCSGGTSCAYDNNTREVTWNIGALNPSTSGQVSVSVTVDTGYSTSSLSNTATLQAEQPGDTPGNPTFSTAATTSVAVATAAGVMSIEKTASTTRVAPDTDMIFTINYQNYGLGPANTVQIIDTLPEGFVFVSCDVSGASHFDQCTESNGIVTVSDSGGPVSVGAGQSGQVAIVAKPAPAPFTFPNPATNTAQINWDSTSASDTATVGVSGTEYCEAVFYFSEVSGTRVATPSAPTGTTSKTISTSSNSNLNFVFEGNAPPTGINAIGSDLTISFYLSSRTGNPTFSVILRDITNNTLIASGSGSTGQTSGVATLFTVKVTNLSQNIPANATLRWEFSVDGNQERIFYFDSTTNNSRSSFCFPTASSPPALTVNKSVDKQQIETGTAELLTYTIKYANVGGSPVTNATVVDTLPTGTTNCEASTDGASWTACSTTGSHTFSIGSVAAGVDGTVYIRALSPANGIQGDSLTNTAVFNSAETSSVQATATTEVGVPGGISGNGTPALSIIKSADKANVGPSETVTYTLKVINTGQGPASAVTVADTIPATAYYQLVSNSLTGGDNSSLSGNNLSWTINSLAIGEAKTLTYQMETLATGIPAGITDRNNQATISDAAYCTGGTPPSSCSSNTVTVRINGNPNLTLTKTASATTGLKPNDNITWTLTLTNTGSAAATAPRIVDPLPTNTNFVSASGGGVLDVLNNQVIWNLADLAAGASTSVTLTAKIKRLTAGQNQAIQNQATASATNASPVTASVQSTASAAPILSLTKRGPEAVALPAALVTETASQSTSLRVDQGRLIDAGQFIQVGGTTAKVLQRRGPLLILDSPVSASVDDAVIPSVTWALSWENSGDAAATSVTLTDTLPTGWTFVEASATPDGTAAQPNGANTIVTWTLASIEPSARGSVTVTAIPATSGDFTNTASLSDALYCTGSTPPSACSASALVRVGGLKITKFTSTPLVFAGDTASYRILVENTLNVALTDVVIDGLLTEGFVYKAGTSKIDGVAVEPTLTNGRPVWSGLNLAPNGEITINLDVTVSSDTAPGTYDSDAVARFVAGSSPTSLRMARSTPLNSAGIVPFDPLSTTQEDVTVLTTQTFLVDGRVFEDQNANGVFDDGEVGFEGIRLLINDDPNNPPYEVFTNEFGQFQQIVDTAGDWEVTPTGGDNTTILTDYQLLQLYESPKTVTLSAENAAAEVLLGYFSTQQTQPTYTLTYDANGGTGTAPTAVTGLAGGQSVTVASPTGLSRTNFVFTAWNTATNGSGTSAIPGGTYTMPAANATLYAQWTAVPVAVNDSYQTTPNTAVSGTVGTNDTYATGSTFSIVTSVSSGTLDTSNFAANGQFSYTPSAQLTSGTDQFVYQVCLPAPNASTCAQATATITVSSSSTPTAPVAVNDSYQTTPNTAVSGTVGTNDTYATGSTFSIVTSVSSGTLDTSNFATSGQFSYTPSAQLTSGTDQFVYKICLPAPNASTCAQATATITVASSEPSPEEENTDPEAIPIPTANWWALLVLLMGLYLSVVLMNKRPLVRN